MKACLPVGMAQRGILGVTQQTMLRDQEAGIKNKSDQLTEMI